MASLIDAAYDLAKANPRRPSQPYLKRGISTAYYAVFGALAQNAADLFVGSGEGRARKAWVQTYRALEHGFAKNACKEARSLGFPPEIVDFCNVFVELQEERYKADYDPTSRYSRADTLLLIQAAERAIRRLASARKSDRRALAILVLLKKR